MSGERRAREWRQAGAEARVEAAAYACNYGEQGRAREAHAHAADGAQSAPPRCVDARLQCGKHAAKDWPAHNGASTTGRFCCTWYLVADVPVS
eukprot:6212227-Pleurochrysis_carterae.AAC.7